MSVKACGMPPIRSIMLNGTINIPLNFLQTFLSTIVGTRTVPRRFILLLGLFNFRVPSKALHECTSFLQTSWKLRVWITYMKLRKDETLIQKCVLKHRWIQQCYQVLKKTFDVLLFCYRPTPSLQSMRTTRQKFKLLS